MAYAIDGLKDLIEAMRALPAELTNEAGAIVMETADDAASDLRAAYPAPTADSVAGQSLRDKVRVERIESGQFGAGARLRSAAKHAFIYEHGTAARYTNHGHYFRGAMPKPAQPIFVPIAIRRRRAMYRQLAALLEKRGAVVTGGTL